jgi:Mn-dependent DtxR family transcriptional regulator
VKSAVRDLTHLLLTIEAQGDYAAAKSLLDRLGVLQPSVAAALDKLKDIPVDIRPIFITADELTRNRQ